MMEEKGQGLFSTRDLYRLIIPLVIEQILAVTIGMADTVMVAVAGEAAVSGISLVDTLNLLLINVFSAMATGGAVVASQYLGKQERENACIAARQLIYTVLGLSVVIMAVCLMGNVHILRALFGTAEADVMSNAEIYLSISALSYPFLAVYNAAAALFRSMGNSKVSMFTATIMNVVNIGGNYIMIYRMGMGVRGAAIASLVARILSAVILIRLLHHHENIIFVEKLYRPDFKPDMVKRILHIGVPNGLENGMFQIGKILVQGLITSFGTVAIAANAVATNIATMQTLPGAAVGLAMITVVGQCVGAGDYAAARQYTKRMMRMAYLAMLVTNILLLAVSDPLVNFYGMSLETTELARQLIILHAFGSIFIWPLSFTLPNALRAASDAKYTMACAIASMWLCRIGCSYLFASFFGMGTFGVWVAMILDWVVRTVLFAVRFMGTKWQSHSLV